MVGMEPQPECDEVGMDVSGVQGRGGDPGTEEDAEPFAHGLVEWLDIKEVDWEAEVEAGEVEEKIGARARSATAQPKDSARRSRRGSGDDASGRGGRGSGVRVRRREGGVLVASTVAVTVFVVTGIGDEWWRLAGVSIVVRGGSR